MSTQSSAQYNELLEQAKSSLEKAIQIQYLLIKEAAAEQDPDDEIGEISEDIKAVKEILEQIEDLEYA